jgi:C-terminal processing protease CtpA/Prc
MPEAHQSARVVARSARLRASFDIVSLMSSARALLTSITFVLAASLGCAAEQRVGSIGAVLSRDNDTGSLHVREVSPGQSAERVGLMPGDEVVMIEGRLARDLDTPSIRAALRGDVGSAVRLTVVRGEKVLRVRIERGALREPGEVRPRVETIKE